MHWGISWAATERLGQGDRTHDDTGTASAGDI